MDLTDPTAAALRIAEAFDAAQTPYALYGGLLLAAYGEPRETRDVDLAVLSTTATEATALLADAGIGTSPNFQDVSFGGVAVDRLMILGGHDDTGLNSLDQVRPRSERYGRQAIERAVRAPLRDGEVSVLTPEDFILFKLLSTRARDLEDAASVLRVSGDALDREMIEREVDVLAGEIPDHDLRERYTALSR